MKPRKWTIALTSLVATGVTAGSILVAGQFATTDQKLAESDPPAPSIITVPVEKKVLQQEITLRCNPAYREQSHIVAPPSATAGQQILTEVFIEKGSTLAEGQLIATINGEPLFIMFGGFPLYRDLEEGDTGPDAQQVNAFLIRTGYLTGIAEPRISTWSISAMKWFLSAQGYPVPTSGGKSDAWSIPARYFTVVQEGGQVLSQLPDTGVLQAASLATIGFGRQGLSCTGRNGILPSGVEPSQPIMIAGFDKPLEVLAVATASTTPEDPGASSAPGPQATESNDTSTAFVAVPNGSDVPRTAEGKVIVGSTPAPVLTVPAGALWTKNGEMAVTRVESDGSRVDIPITSTFSANGMHAVKDSDGRLQVGDRVLVGDVQPEITSESIE